MKSMGGNAGLAKMATGYFGGQMQMAYLQVLSVY